MPQIKDDRQVFSPITSDATPTAEDLARQQLARIAREDEIKRRREALIEQSKREAIGGKVRDSVIVDGVEMPLKDAFDRIPAQLDFEDHIQNSPLKKRALAQSRKEELIEEGTDPVKAEEQARKEQEERQASYDLGRELVRKEKHNADKEVRGFMVGTTTAFGARLARIAGFGHTADGAEAFNAGTQAELNQHRDENYAYPKIAGAIAGAAQNTANMGTGVAASMIAGPGAGMAVMAGDFGSQEYSRAAYEGKEAGLAGGELEQYALIQGGVEAAVMPIFSKIPGLGGIEGRVLKQSIARGVAAHPSMRKALVSGAAKLTKDTAAEIVEEVTTEVLHGVASEKLLSENVDYKAVIKDTVLQTVIMMGMTEGVQQAGRLVGSGEQPAAPPAESQPVPVAPITPEEQVFLQQPSRTKYDAAVKAGMPPVAGGESGEVRKKYAAERLQAQNTAPLEPEAPPVEALPGNVPDIDVDEVWKDFAGDQNVEDTNQVQQQGNEVRNEGQQGRQEGLLETPETPPGIGGMTAAAPTNESAVSSALAEPQSKMDQHLDMLNEGEAKPRSQKFRDDMATALRENAEVSVEKGEFSTFGDPADPKTATKLDAVREYLESQGHAVGPVTHSPDSGTSSMTIAAGKGLQPETPIQTPPDLASGVSSPDQPAPSLAGPVSKRPWEMKREDYAKQQAAIPASGGMAARANYKIAKSYHRQQVADALAEGNPVPAEVLADYPDMQQTGKSEQSQTPEPELPKGAIGFNADGNPIYESKTGLRTVGDETEQEKSLKSFKDGPMRAILAAPREDRFKTTDELAEPASQPLPAFLALPQKSQDLFNKAFESKDIPSLKQMVDKSNVAWNKEFERRTGVKLPKTLKGRYQAVLDWAAPVAKPEPKVNPEPSATEHDRLYKELQPLYRDPKHKSGDREHMARIRDLEQQVEFHKPAAVARAQAEIDSETAKKPMTPEAYAKLPMLDVYPLQRKDGSKFAVKESDKSGFGDSLFDTEAEARAYADRERQRSAEKADREAKAQAKEEADQKKQQEHEASFQGFLTDDPKTKGRRLKTLDTLVNYEKKPITRKALVEQRVADGWTVNDEDQFQAPTGEFLDAGALTKTGIDYARHLVNRSQAVTKPDEAKEPENKPQAEPSQEDLMEQILREELLGETSKPKKERKPRTPKEDTGEPKAPRTPRVEAAKKRTEKTAAELKAAEDRIRKAFGSTANMGLNAEQMRATAGLVRAALNHNVSTFNEFVAYVVDTFGEPLALQMAEGIELAWRSLRRLPDYSGIDDAGNVADVINQKAKASNENQSERDEPTADGGSEAAGRPLGQERVEEPSTDNVPEDGTGGDAGRSGDSSGGRSAGETSGTAESGGEGTGSVPASPARNDRTAGRSGRLDFRITAEDKIGEKFNFRERFDKNVEAIKVLKQIESENRRATVEEQKVLAQYVGWGGLKEAFSTRDDQGLREKAILKDLLTEQELEQARTSVRNAHYTSPEVISAMWEGLTDAGFAGGRILEPSMGIGHFYGMVPESVAAVSKLSGIEMDGLTARIAQQLYQTADITHAPYQDVNVKNLQDLVISNVPFGPYKAKDKYNKDLKKKASIHNFFFLKAMTNVRPGGVIAFITSRYTMDGRTAEHMEVREKIAAAGGRFVGAVRLPNNAFMGIAKTKVTTDVIFIQKDAGDAQPWINTIENAGGFVFNEYYKEHPENVLGKIDPKGGTQMNEWGIAPDGHDIGKELAQKIAAMPFDRSALAENSTEDADTSEDDGEATDVPDGRLAIRGGKLFKAVGGKLEEVPLWGGERGQERKFAIIQSMASLANVRDKLSDLEMSPDATDAEIERARKRLNTAYDKFVQENGFIHKGENQGLFRPDEQLPTLLALEEWDTDTKTAKKADVFEKRVQRPAGSASTPTTAEGAAVESYARLGRIDLPMISEWLGKPESQVEKELAGWAYKNPDSGEWSLKNVYLSGNIAKKLKDAEAAAKKDPAFQKNVEDLKRVLPPRKTAGQIHVRARSPFITPVQYHQFMQHLGVNGTVRHEELTGAWLIDNPHIEDPVKAGPWGVGKKTAADLLDGLLNNKPPVVWTKDYNGDRVVDHAATQLARAKAKEIEDEFGRWIFSEPERAKQIEDVFNETVGAYIEGEWDGSHLELPGMNVNVTLLPHQKNAIWRAIVSGNTMLAHEVGLGKTFIMAAIAMERKRLGLATNQMFVVPNHLLSQWASEFKALYPSAKLLALESDQINSTNRRTLMERIKSGRFDAIIVTPEAYKKMPMSNEIVEAKLREITKKIEDTIKESKKAKGENKNFVAKLESVLESVRGKMEKMLNDPAKDAGAKFDELGIDSIYVDEAHEYRNLWSMTQMGDISGVGLDGNQKTFDMLLKTDYLNEKTNSRGIVFATGTPIANSISELYSMQRYLQPKMLAEAGVASFDDWANTFGEAVTDIEVDPTGSGFRSKTRFKEFRNTIALSKLFRQIADVKYAEDKDVGLDKFRPKLRGGKLHAIQVMPSVGLLSYVRNLVFRLEMSKSRSFDKRIDNPLKVTTDGRKAALDMRLVMPEEDGISSKINHAVENVARIYNEESERKGAQLLWVNLGTPASAKKKGKKGKKDSDVEQPDQDFDSPDAQMNSEEDALESGRINAYEDIKQKLMAQGIPENEIAFIHDYDSKDRKRALFQKVREGKVRIVVSTVKKLATGANIQTRMAAMHFLDPPWKPADIEQALGRAIRRGNLYKDWGDVQAYTYVTRGSFDAYIWQLLENKAKAIKQIMRGESDSVEDTGRIELNADEVKALASSNPKVLELVKVRNDVGQLRAEYYGHRAEQGNVQSQIAQRTGSLDYSKRYLKSVEAEVASLPSRDDLHSGFKATIGKKTYSKRSEIGAALVEAMPLIDWTDKDKSAEMVKELSTNPVKIGSALGYPIYAGRSAYDNSARIIIGKPDGDYFKPSDDDTGNGVKLFNYFDKKYDEPGRLKAAIEQGEQELAALQLRAGQTWPKSDRLKADEESLNRLELELGADAGKKGELPVVSALTKFAIMAEKLGRQEGRPVTFDGTQWMHGDRMPVKAESVTTEMEEEVDREVALLLVESKEAPHESFFFHKSKERKAAEKSRAELSALQLMKRQYDKAIFQEVKKVFFGRSTAWTGLPITDELARLIVNRMVVSIKEGVKQFEVFIRDLRVAHSEEVVRKIKPNLIRAWNGLQEKQGLDEATDIAFEAAVTKTKDLDIEQAVELAKGEPETMPAEQPAEGKLYSTKNAFSAAQRQELGMEERPEVPRLDREPSVDMAKAEGQTKQGSDRIDALIAELTVQPRAVSPYENDLLNFRNAELGNKLDDSLRKQIDARKSGDSVQEAIAQTAASVYRTAKQALIELVLEPIGTAAGRALQARKAAIKDDYTLERLALEYEAAYGDTPSTKQLEEMQKKIDALDADKAALQKLLDEANAKNEDLEKRFKENHDAKVSKAAKKPPETAVEKTGKERSRTKINEGFRELTDMLKPGKAYSIGGVVGDVSKAFVKIAEGYSELGVITLGEFLKRVGKRMGPDVQKVLPQLTAAWKQVASQFTGKELESITNKLDITDVDTIGRVARDLHSFVIERDGLDASAEGREAAVDAVHQILIDFIPELTRDQVHRAMSGIGIYSELSQDEVEVIRRDQKAQLLSLQQITDWRKGQAPPATGQERPPVSQEQRELRRAVNEAKKAAGIVEATAGQLRSALDAAKRMAANRIKDLTKAIETQTPISASRKLLQPDAELEKLRETRDALQKLYDEAFGKRELSDEQRLNAAEKALDRAISNLEADLKAGKLYNDDTRAPLTSPALEAKRAQLDALKASREEMRLQSGESQARSDAAYERHLLERDARLAQRLADKDFAPKEKRPERELTPAMLKLALSIQRKNQQLQAEIKKWEFDKKHIIVKLMTWGPVATSAIIRKGLTSIDQSLIGRQGYLLGIINPAIYGKAIRKAFSSNPFDAKSLFPTEQDLFNTQTALDADPVWVRREKIGGLAVTDVHGGFNREEDNQFVPEWVDKWVPGVAGSERAGSAFINTLRRLVFRSLVDKLAKRLESQGKTLSDADLKVIANFVNVSTGRGDIKKFASTINAASTVFFSPRWWISRLQWLSGQPIWHGARWTDGKGASTDVRKMIAMEMGKQLAAQAAIIGLATAALAAAFGAPGDDEEWDFYWDPASPHFGKIRVGNTMIDMTAGLGQHLSYFFRVTTGRQDGRWEADEVDKGRLTTSYFRGKLAPIPSVIGDYIAGTSMSREKFGTGSWFADKVTPLMIQDVLEASEKEGMPLAPVISALMFFGVGARSFDERTTERRDVANEVRAAMKQGKPQAEIDALLNEHFATQAATQAKDTIRTADPEDVEVLEKIVAGDKSPELDQAIQNEKGDLALVASERLSAEDATKKKSADDDKGITTARDLLKILAPKYDDANKLYTEAYKRRNGPTTELVGEKGKKRYVTKKNVLAARRRLKAMYPE